MIGKIQVKQPVQAIPIAAPVLSKSPLKWSEDNAICLATHFGACIFKLNISPYADQAGILYERIYISPPSSANPNILSGPALLKLAHKLNRDEAQKIMLDATLTAAHRAGIELPTRRINQLSSVVGQNGEENYLGFCNSAWSYKGAIEGDGCILCLTTYDHQILLVGQVGMRWKTLTELTGVWAKYVSGRGKKLLKKYTKTIGKEDHHLFISNTRFLGMTELLWTSVMKDPSDEDFSILFLVTASSHLALIRVPIFEREKEFEPSVLECFALSSSHGKVTALNWIPLNDVEGLLIVGTVKGYIEIYHLTFQPEYDVQCLFSFENLAPGMSVNHLNLCCLNKKKNRYILYAGQHNILLGYLLVIAMPTVKVLSSTHSVLGCLAISAVKVIGSTVYASLKDGKIIEVMAKSKVNKISFVNNDTVFSSEGVLYNGFCFSPNATFVAILECVSVPYDHLQLREPTVISLFQVNTFSTVLKYILEETSKPLSFQVDAYESLRLLSYREEKSSFPKLNLKDIPLLETHLKKVRLWISALEFGSLNQKGRSSDRKHLEEIIEALEKSVLLDNISEIFSSCTMEEFPTNAKHRLSLHFMCNFFQDNKVKNPLLKKIKNRLKKEKVKGIECCLICSNPIIFSSIKFAECPEGHSLPRCFRSLLSTFPTLNCIHCNLFYHPEASKWYGVEGRKCLICSRKLINRYGMRSGSIRTNPSLL